MFEQDYIMRQIREMIAVIMKLIFGKEIESAEAIEQYRAEGKGEIELFCRMIDRGEIAEAERLLYDSITMKTEAELLKGYAFYQYLMQKDDVFLETHGFPRDRVIAGIRQLAALFGARHIADMFFAD